VGNRYIEKRINVKIEHVKPSKCRQDYLDRVKEYNKLRAEAKEKGEKIILKRQPSMPQVAHVVSTAENKPVLVRPISYESLL
jgi:large subunit ribosomal protein L21e